MKNLRDKRKQLGMTQEELAKQAHISREYVNYLERGKYECGVKTARAIAKVLGCDWVELYDD